MGLEVGVEVDQVEGVAFPQLSVHQPQTVVEIVRNVAQFLVKAIVFALPSVQHSIMLLKSIGVKLYAYALREANLLLHEKINFIYSNMDMFLLCASSGNEK